MSLMDIYSFCPYSKNLRNFWTTHVVILFLEVSDAMVKDLWYRSVKRSKLRNAVSGGLSLANQYGMFFLLLFFFVFFFELKGRFTAHIFARQRQEFLRVKRNKWK